MARYANFTMSFNGQNINASVACGDTETVSAIRISTTYNGATTSGLTSGSNYNALWIVLNGVVSPYRTWLVWTYTTENWVISNISYSASPLYTAAGKTANSTPAGQDFPSGSSSTENPATLQRITDLETEIAALQTEIIGLSQVIEGLQPTVTIDPNLYILKDELVSEIDEKKDAVVSVLMLAETWDEVVIDINLEEHVKAQ
jgi:hypothetical protein